MIDETKFELLKLADIVAAPYNPRVDIGCDSEEYRKLWRSIEQHGLVEPPIVNLHNMRCIGGNQRLTVLRDMGVEEVLCSVIDQPDEIKEKKLCLALNKIDGRWDEHRLEDLLSDEEVVEFETGFEEDEIADYLHLSDLEDDDAWDGEEYDGLDEEESDEDDTDGQEDTPKVQTTLIRIGTVTFSVDIEDYQELVYGLRDKGIFDKNSVRDELKRRLLYD